MKSPGYVVTGAAVLLMLALATPLAAQADDPSPIEGKSNVELIFTIGKIEDGQRVPTKAYRLILAEGPVGSRLLAGKRVPFPGAAGEVVYQNVGFATEARVWVVDEKTIKVVADIEDSRVQPGESGGAPSVETRQMAVSAILTDGVALEVTRAHGVAGISGYVELEANILD